MTAIRGSGIMQIQENCRLKRPAAPRKKHWKDKTKFWFWLFSLQGNSAVCHFVCHLSRLKRLGAGTRACAGERSLFHALVFLMTMLLLTSSLTSVYAIYHMKNFNAKR